MSNYLLFNTDNVYTDDNGNECTLDRHLFSLYKYGGSPDNFDSAENNPEAIEKADSEEFGVVVVSSLDYEILYYNDK